MQKKFTTKEVVIVAMVAAVIGVVYTLLDYAYMPLSAVLGTVFMELHSESTCCRHPYLCIL